MMFTLMAKREVVLTFHVLVEVVDDIGDREYQGFLEIPLEAHPLLGVGVPMKEVIEVLCTWQWQENPEIAMDQHMQEEVSEWR